MPTTVVQAPAGEVKPHPAFKQIVKGKPALYVWHVAKLDLETVPNDQIGTFFSGDCYLVFAVKDRHMTDLRVHFWIGANCSIDERAVAAMMAVALDDHFLGFPVQYREVQGAESAMFMQYFSERGRPLRYLDGGVASGLRHVTKKVHRNALFPVKGSVKACRITEVPISWDSINEGDTYVFDVGPVIFVWKGKHSRKTESFSGCKFAHQLRTERHLKRCVVLVVDDGSEETDLTEDYLELWNKHLPLDKKQLKTAAEGGTDDAAVKEHNARIKLYCCKEEGGSTSINELKTGPLNRSDLRSEDTFIVDNGPSGVWAWIGKTASKQERRFAMHYASEFVSQNNYPATTRVARMIDGGETVAFKALFAKWPAAVTAFQAPYSFNKIAKPTEDENFDAQTLHDDPKKAAESQMFDNGQGTKEIMRCERKSSPRGARYDLVPQDKPVLYGGDCYIIVYTTETNQTVLYFWIGRTSSQDERGACAAMVVDMDNVRFKGAAIQVRVGQGKEPRHFMAIFGGLLTTFEGGKAGWNKADKDKAIGETYLLQIHCESRLDRKVIQVPLTAESLNSSDTFVLVRSKASKTYIWCGKGSLDSERQLAIKVAKTCVPNVEPAVITEGSEANDFWSFLGGQKPYQTSKTLADPTEAFVPRLFQCTNQSGRFTVNEVEPFTQDDLAVDDVMLLDANEAIYVWIGDDSNKKERELGIKAAADYLESDPKGRDPNLPIYVIKQGNEPLSFTGFFTAWDPKLWSLSKSFEEMKAEFDSEANEIKLTAKEIEAMRHDLGVELSFDEVEKFPYEKLTQPKDILPRGVDSSNREKHLTAEEFSSHFSGMTYEEFSALPAWKRTNLKRIAKLH